MKTSIVSQYKQFFLSSFPLIFSFHRLILFLLPQITIFTGFRAIENYVKVSGSMLVLLLGVFITFPKRRF